MVHYDEDFPMQVGGWKNLKRLQSSQYNGRKVYIETCMKTVATPVALCLLV